MLKIVHVVGARPNFIKIAPITAEMARYPDYFQQALVHTGQHYDYNMSRVFFEELQLPEPDQHLDVRAGSHAEQTARILLAFEPVIEQYQPDMVIVVGDVNSTLACALVCAKLGIPVAHVEAGLRSHDRSMPEEINRVLTDQMADLHFTPSRDANDHLLREGIPSHKICFVGNVMIDTLVHLLPLAKRRWPLKSLRLPEQNYVLVTLHRPQNVDNVQTITAILAALEHISREIPVIFPVHPRTRQRVSPNGHLDGKPVHLIEPQGYLNFLALEQNAALVITDSGGVQEETTYLDIPCLTIRPNTERPITITIGTNRLIPASKEAIVAAVRETLSQPRKRLAAPELWDGRAAQRIVEVLKHWSLAEAVSWLKDTEVIRPVV